MFTSSPGTTALLRHHPHPNPPAGRPPTCNAWGSININNCTQAGWQSTPKSPNCITGTRTNQTLYLSSSGATRMAFYNAPDTATNCSNVADGDYTTPQTYATSRSWNLSVGYENKKVCARFINNNGDAKCGALIQYTAPTPTFTPSPTPTPYIRVRTYKPDGTNQTASLLCKVNCANSPCIYNNAGNPCQSNLALADFPLAGGQFNRGGGMCLQRQSRKQSNSTRAASSGRPSVAWTGRKPSPFLPLINALINASLAPAL